jgi:hypothetical protein
MSEEAGYPGGANLVHHWKESGSHGHASLPVQGTTLQVDLEWSGYRFSEDSYLASHFGQQFLVRFSLNGKPLLAHERYVDTSITSAGRQVHGMEYTSRDGVCATELVKALQAGQEIELELDPNRSTGSWYRAASLVERDQRHHEIEIEEFTCIAYFNLEEELVEIARSRLRDSGA